MKTIKARDIRVGMWVRRIYENGGFSPFKEVKAVRYLGNGSTVVVAIESRYMYFDALSTVWVK